MFRPIFSLFCLSLTYGCDYKNVRINEINSDQPGSDSLSFIELYDGGENNTPLDQFQLSLVSAGSPQPYAEYKLTDLETDDNGFFLAGMTDTNPDLTIPDIQNGPDAVLLYCLESLVDVVVYKSAGRSSKGADNLIAQFTPGQALLIESDSKSVDRSLSRCRCQTPATSECFLSTLPSPRQLNQCDSAPTTISPKRKFRTEQSTTKQQTTTGHLADEEESSEETELEPENINQISGANERIMNKIPAVVYLLITTYQFI